VECGKVSCDNHRVTGHSHMTEVTWGLWQSIATKVKYISSIENPMGTLSSSPCQLWLGVNLSYHS